jgi:hypothetical protein
MTKTEAIFISLPRGGLLDGQDQVANSDDWNYWAIAIQDKTGYYLWAKGVSIKVTPNELVEIIKSPTLATDSVAHRIHERIDTMLCLESIRLKAFKKSS